jgi:hypothetical protein
MAIGALRIGIDIGAKVSQSTAPVIKPLLESAVIEAAVPDEVVLTFDQRLNEAAIAASAFSITGKIISSVAIVDYVVTLTLSADVNFTDVLTVDYTKPASNPLKALVGGGEVDSFTAAAITNNVTADPATAALITRMNATGESRPTNYDIQLDILIKGLKADGYWDGFWDVLVNLRGGTGVGAATARLNLIKDAHNATEVNTPSYTAGLGYKTGGTGYINTNYKIKTDKVKLGRLDAGFLLKLSGTIASGLHGAGSNSTVQVGVGGFGNVFLANGGVARPRIVGYNGFARNEENNYHNFQGSTDNYDAGVAALESNLPQLDCWILNYSLGSYLVGNAEVAELYGFSKYMTITDFVAIQARFNTFYANV